MKIIFLGTMVLFLLILVLFGFSFLVFLKKRRAGIQQMVEGFERAGLLADEEGYRESCLGRSSQELKEEYDHYMKEINKFEYPNNQEYVMELAHKANVLREILDERGERPLV